MIVAIGIAISLARSLPWPLAAMAVTPTPASAPAATAFAIAVIAAAARTMVMIARPRFDRGFGGDHIPRFLFFFLFLDIRLFDDVGFALHRRCCDLHHGRRRCVAGRQSLQPLDPEIRRHQGIVGGQIYAEALANLQLGQ